MALNAREEMFCQVYAERPCKGQGTRSAISAGYPEERAKVDACELLQRFDIQERLGQIFAQRVDKSEADTKLILESLRETIRLSRVKVPKIVRGRAVLDEDGKPVKLPADTKGMIKAAELLGKYHALWVERKEIKADLSLEEILAETER